MRRAALLAVVLLALTASAAASTGTAPSPAQLLRTYAPILVLHPSERFHPEAVDGYLADADLVGSHYDQRLCRAIGGPAALACYASADAAHASPPLVYAAAFPSAGRMVLEYWTFYPFDLYQAATVPPFNAFWQDHEADWEAVAVVLDTTVRATPKPLLLAVSRHCSGARRDWARAARQGTHPTVYVALGSHGGYFAPGEFPLDRSCWPPLARAIITSYAVPLRDHVAAGRRIVPAIAPISASTPSWMTFAGNWGAQQYVHVPKNAPFAYGYGPTGPAFHALWRKPLATVLAWPRG